MPLVFPVLVGRENGRFQAETPALPGWTCSAPDVDAVLDQAKVAIEAALNDQLEATAVISEPHDGLQLHEITIDEPMGWWDKDPTE